MLENTSLHNLLIEHYQKSTDGILLCDHGSKVIEANQALCNMFGYSAEEITELTFTDLIDVDVSNPACFCQAKNRDAANFLVVLERYVHPDSENVLYIIRDESHSVEATKSVFGTEQSTNRFKELLKNLHKISVELSNSNDMDELYRRTIELSLAKLEIERIALFLLDEKKNMVGTFGTDEFGHVVDERDYKKPLSHFSIVLEAITRRDYVTVYQDQDLVHFGKKVGKGWQAMVTLWDKEKPIGFLAADNLIHHRALTPHIREIFGLLGSVLSHVIIKKRAEFRLKKMNEELELIIAKRTLELEQKIKQLMDTQEKLVEAEKIASLGNLVSGVAHEINTPLGVSITAASLLRETTQQLCDMMATGSIKKSALQYVADTSKESIDLIEHNLDRAANLVKSFKALAVDQTSDNLVILHPHNVVKNILLSYHHELKNKPITVKNEISFDLAVRNYSGALVQVVLNLLLNSVQHGFNEGQGGEINITAEAAEQGIVIHYSDTGKGVAESDLKLIFEPFYTTARQVGAGLGLNQVYNLISQKMSGEIRASLPERGGLKFDIYLPNL